MPDYSDAAITDALRRHMTLAAAKQAVAASNLANVSTPGYRAREVDFSETLIRHVSDRVALVKTQPGHLDDPAARTDDGGLRTREIAGLDARRDGNNVEIDRVMLAMTSAAGDFSRAQVVLSAKFKLLRYAIGEK